MKNFANYVRVYSNGTRVNYNILESEIESQVDYDKNNRMGCAIFINGECKQTGYLSLEKCIEIGKELQYI